MVDELQEMDGVDVAKQANKLGRDMDERCVPWKGESWGYEE